MYSVTKRISMIKQPRGGYINKKQFEVKTLDDGKMLNEVENIHPTLVGLAVDYLTRFMMGTPAKDAFNISLQGAMRLDLFLNNASENKYQATLNAVSLLEGIKGLDKKSIENACKLSGYDVCLRASIVGYKPIEDINPDSATIENISIMVNRCLSFWKDYGPIINDGFTFEGGGYTELVSSGDGDYLTQDTLWDLKVSKDEPKAKHTLQILMYYIMGRHSMHSEFYSIKKLGIFNPRMNKVYTLDVSSISAKTIKEIEKDVIGY